VYPLWEKCRPVIVWVLPAIFVPWGSGGCTSSNPGKGGLLLALVATLMPLIWEKAAPFAKSAWILALFMCFLVEYKAIDKDRKEFAEQQSQAREGQNRQFSNLLNQEKQDLKEILDQEGRNLTAYWTINNAFQSNSLRESQSAK